MLSNTSRVLKLFPAILCRIGIWVQNVVTTFQIFYHLIKHDPSIYYRDYFCFAETTQCVN